MSAGDISRIAVVGAGLVGRAWAIVFARAGFDVAVYDESATIRAGVMSAIEASLAELTGFELLGEPVAAVLARVRVHDSLASALEGAGYVQESVIEDLALKRTIHASIASLAGPGTIQASSTSGIPASAWSEGLANRSHCLVAHPINPPHVVPLVEVCGAPWTSPTVVERVVALQKAAGQSPVTLRKEVSGFVVNRLQGALLSEAFRLYADGVASAEDIDKTIRDGLGLRWSFMGPFETIDLNAPGGIADYCARFGSLYHQLALEAKPRVWDEKLVRALEDERRRALAEDQLKARSAWRDRKLMALIAHKRG
jgi:3-hydroxyacyl-CoA dehydrogenase